MICNYCAAVHLRAGAHHCQNTTHRNNFVIRIFHTQVILIPWVLITISRYGKCLCIITDRTSAHCKNQIHMIFSCKLTALVQLLYSWVWHNAGKLYDTLTAVFEDSNNFIIQTRLFNRTAAISQQYCFTVFRKLFTQMI